VLNCPKGAQQESKESITVTRAVRQTLSKQDYNARILDATFLPNLEAVVTLNNLKPSKQPYLIVPATYGREKTGAFLLEVTGMWRSFCSLGVANVSLMCC